VIFENDSGLDSDLQQVGCYAESIAMWNPNITDEEMNLAWEKAKNLHYVDTDLNSPTYQELLNPDGLVAILGYPLRLRIDAYGSSHYPASTLVNPQFTWIIGCWKHPPYSHFVVMNGMSIGPEAVIYDPIPGPNGKISGSHTVAEGAFDSYRLFDIIGGAQRPANQTPPWNPGQGRS